MKMDKTLCGCGCGKWISCKDKWGRLRSFMKGHFFKLYNKPENNMGDKNGSWKGGKRIDVHGYVWILDHSHPYGDSHGYVRKHRLAMEKYLGRYLEKYEIVHHIDGNKQNNKINNLQLMTKKEHDSMKSK